MELDLEMRAATASLLSISSRRRSSWRSRNSGGISARIGRPTASAMDQPNMRSAAAFQLLIMPVGVERDEGVGRAVEHEPRARLALAQLAGALLGLARLGAQVLEQPRDQQAGDQRGAHREQPADTGLGGSSSASRSP